MMNPVHFIRLYVDILDESSGDHFFFSFDGDYFIIYHKFELLMDRGWDDSDGVYPWPS